MADGCRVLSSEENQIDSLGLFSQLFTRNAANGQRLNPRSGKAVKHVFEFPQAMQYKNKILLVEDHEDTSELMVLLLSQLDYDVVTTTSVAGALQLAESAEFDLFVFDSLLTDGTGTELCKRIRQRDGATPILFYSAQAYDRDKDEALLAGAQKYLVKPVDTSVFCSAVTELLTAHPRSRVSA